MKGIRERLQGFRNKQEKKDDNPLTPRQAAILTVGVQLHAEGIPWWHAIQMIEELQNREFIPKGESSRAWVYPDLAKLQRDAMIQARWNIPEEIEPRKTRRYFRVTDEGRKERSKVRLESKSKSPALNPKPQTEPA